MYGRAAGLDRFKKAQSLEPFSVSANSSSKPSAQPGTKVVSHSSSLPSQSQTSFHQVQHQQQPQQQVQQNHASHGATGLEAAPLLGQTQQATQVLDRINLDRRRLIFGRQIQTCDFVLDHQSVSRQHAAVVPHKNGSIYVIDLGSAHGTFVANERLTKDSPVELEVGQSLRFAASTRTYMLRKNDAALFPRPPLLTEIDLPPPPDPSDEEAVVAYNTIINRYGLGKVDQGSRTMESSRKNDNHQSDRASKRIRKMRVTFRDQVGGELVEVVGVSDGADVGTEPGPVGVKEGSLVGKYESLVQITVIPKGKEQSVVKEADSSQKGVTDKLQEVLKKVKTTQKVGIYDDLYGESFSAKVGSSWAYSSVSTGEGAPPDKVVEDNGKPDNNLSSSVDGDNEDDDDLFG
ncbi:hypothetical protein K1719_024660 [Acacia pycnantha]|nr:hypothetical protein K1719_024660 [Acacia pycnantha]